MVQGVGRKERKLEEGETEMDTGNPALMMILFFHICPRAGHIHVNSFKCALK